MICILVLACVLFKQGETSQGTNEEKKTGMIQEWSRISVALGLYGIGSFCHVQDLFVLW